MRALVYLGTVPVPTCPNITALNAYDHLKVCLFAYLETTVALLSKSFIFSFFQVYVNKVTNGYVF
jgi:hypothetical protein